MEKKNLFFEGLPKGLQIPAVLVLLVVEARFGIGNAMANEFILCNPTALEEKVELQKGRPLVFTYQRTCTSNAKKTNGDAVAEISASCVGNKGSVMGYNNGEYIADDPLGETFNGITFDNCKTILDSKFNNGLNELGLQEE